VRTNGPLLFLNEGGGKFRQGPTHFSSPPSARDFHGCRRGGLRSGRMVGYLLCLYLPWVVREQ